LQTPKKKKNQNKKIIKKAYKSFDDESLD